MTEHEWEVRMQTAVMLLDSINIQGDEEVAHSVADGILLSAVSPEVKEAWNRVVERCGPFWYA